MGFKEARAFIVDALRSARIRHEHRADIEEKNLLRSRVVDEAFVARLLLRCAGWEYSTSRHHHLDVECHIFTPALGGERWYIKAYVQDDLAFFISVHP